MILVALRGLAGRKLRSALTAVAIVLGVAMISGTYILTDTISGAFDAIFVDAYRGSDVVVTGPKLLSSGDGPTEFASFPQSLVEQAANAPGVASATGEVESPAADIIDKKGKAISFGSGPHLGFSIDPTRPEAGSLRLVEGSWPQANEVVIDAAAAK
jgi:putative ABC transport system permease protein